MLKTILNNVRKTKPLIHSITNYVTANDCANILLACGASPTMADHMEEAEEISSISAATNINIGTLNPDTISAMFLAGKKANELGHPVVLDPVGAGASKLRTEISKKLIDEINFTVIRGNISEIKTLANGSGNNKGVDAGEADKVTEDKLEAAVEFAKTFAKRIGAIVAISGAIDIVTDGENCWCIYNGCPMMSSVTGTGCQLSALIAAFVGANPDKALEATAAAVCAMGVCGEIAYERLGEMDGNSSYRNYIIDAIYKLDGETLENRVRYKLI